MVLYCDCSGLIILLAFCLPTLHVYTVTVRQKKNMDPKASGIHSLKPRIFLIDERIGINFNFSTDEVKSGEQIRLSIIFSFYFGVHATINFYVECLKNTLWQKRH